MGKASRKKREIGDVAGSPAAGPSLRTKGTALWLLAGGRVIPLLIIAAVGCIAYMNTFGVPFAFDDGLQISTNSMIKNFGNFMRYLHDRNFAPEGYASFSPSRIVGYLTLAMNYATGGLEVTGYHIFNLTVHVINAVLVYFLVLLTFQTPYFTAGSSVRSAERKKSYAPGAMSEPHAPDPMRHAQFIALFAALLFVSHPIQTQAVTYIIQRFASLATMFYLAAIVIYIKGRSSLDEEGEGNPKTRGLKPLIFFSLSLLSALLAMKTKEIAFTLPLIVVLYEFMFFSAPLKKRLLVILPMLLLLIIIPLTLLGTNRSLGELLSDVTKVTRVQTNISRADYFLTELTVISKYIQLIFLPLNQNLDYDYPIYHSFFAPRVFLSFLFLSAVLGTAGYLLYKSQRAFSYQPSVFGGQPPEVKHDSRFTFRDSRRSDYRLLTTHYLRVVAFGIFWFFIAISVESSFIPISDVIFEHRVYLPSVGAFIALAACVNLVADRFGDDGRKKALVTCTLLIAVLSAATFMRNNVWRSEVSLWEDVVKKSPNKVRGLNILAGAYLKVSRIDDAKYLLDKLSQMTFDSPDVEEGYYVNVASLKTDAGSLDEAEAALGKALEINGKSFQVYSDLCSVYIKKKKLQEAFDACNRSLRLLPGYPPALSNLSAVYRKLGNMDEAIRSAETALVFDPEYAPPHNNLGLAYVEQKKTAEAIMEFREALVLEPAFTEAYNNLAGAYMMSGDYASAIGEFRKALEINPNYVQSHYNLGVAYFISGNRDEAMKELAALQKISPKNADALTVFMRQQQGEQPPQ